MNGSKIFLDTNIIIYLLSGDEVLPQLIKNKEVYLSEISEMELLSFPGLSEKNIQHIEAFLDNCTIIEMNSLIKNQAIYMRRNHKLKLPDAIVVSTAFVHNIDFMTADKKLFKIKELNILEYHN